MLAEIFMMRLEATSRGSGEIAPSSNSRFVPFRIDLLERKSDEANRELSWLARAAAGRLFDTLDLKEARRDAEAVDRSIFAGERLWRITKRCEEGSDVFHELPAWHLPRLDRVMMRNRDTHA